MTTKLDEWYRGAQVVIVRYRYLVKEQDFMTSLVRTYSSLLRYPELGLFTLYEQIISNLQSLEACPNDYLQQFNSVMDNSLIHCVRLEKEAR
ncbi:hypothetical protein X975_07652, partial [Stegodyphus mimosarum]